MKLQVEITKFRFYVLIALFVCLTATVLVAGFGGTSPAVLGHTVGELQGTPCGGTNKLTVDGSGAFVCAADVDTNTDFCSGGNCANAITVPTLIQITQGGGDQMLLHNTGSPVISMTDGGVTQTLTFFGGSVEWNFQGNLFASGTGQFGSTVRVSNGVNVVLRCTGAGALPVGALTVSAANCAVSADTGLRLA